jgi:hypothetical protein
MNVTVLDPAARHAAVSAEGASAVELPAGTGDWIDPEGDDWFAEIYRELTRETATASLGDQLDPERDHWFG